MKEQNKKKEEIPVLFCCLQESLPYLPAYLSNCPPAAAAAAATFVWRRECEQRERGRVVLLPKIGSGGLYRICIVWINLLFLPPPRLTLVFCLTLSFPILYIYFLFSFPFLLIYLFISCISCAFVLSPLPSISLPSFQHLTYRTTEEEEKEEHIPLLPLSVSIWGETDIQTDKRKER